jgi:DGQHR domain-containing protein
LSTTELRLPALEVKQRKRRLYQFAVDGKRLTEFASVSRIRRDEHSEIQGYQRPEAIAHVRAIRTYLETGDALMPNALVVAFDRSVRFEPSDGQPASSPARVGTLIIPIQAGIAEEDKPGWIVDGQQRAAALRDAKIRRFPVPMVGFITSQAAEQRAQFILVNSTKPLPRGLIHELLPATKHALPAALERKRLPAVLLDRLNNDTTSPLRGLIRTPTEPAGIVKDNSILTMLEHSISDGALFAFRDPRTGGGDTRAMLDLLYDYWRAVREVFSDAWGKPPRHSRLMHGVGVVSLGFLMDAITDHRAAGSRPDEATYAADLKLLRPVCAWTEGSWQLGIRDSRRWNELQNTPKDISLLTDFLLDEYRARINSGARVIRRAAS